MASYNFFSVYIENRREGGIITLRSSTTDSAIKVVALSNSQAIAQFLSLSMEVKSKPPWPEAWIYMFANSQIYLSTQYKIKRK